MGCTPSLEVVFNAYWIDDGTVPVDTDGDGQYDSGCGDVYDVFIWDYYRSAGAPEDLWRFGWVSAAPQAWTGEDCLHGSGPVAVCHEVPAEFRLSEVCRADQVVGGVTTLFDWSRAPRLTYYLANTCDCLVFGEDTAYYAALGCYGTTTP